MSRLRLPDVTLVCADCITPDLSRVAIETCTRRVDFAKVLVVSDVCLLRHPQDCEWWPIAQAKSIHEATSHLWYTIPKLVDTSHFLYIQWDSWVVNPDQWSDEFLAYDYIGAPWWRVNEPHNVGNGGFSLRSTKLMKRLCSDKQKYPFLSSPEDDAICRHYGSALEAEGFKFPSTETAIKFSFERLRPTTPENVLLPTFGFHGMFNWPDVLSDDEIADRVALAPEHVLSNEHFFQMNHELSKRGRRTHHRPIKSRLYGNA